MTLDLTSTQNPRVKAAVALRTGRDRRAAGLLLADGPRQVERAAGAGLAGHELFWCPDLLPVAPQVPGARLYRCNRAVMEKLAYRNNPEGVVGVFDAPQWTLPQALDQAAAPALWLIAVGVEKPGNLGAMARTAEAAGAAGLLVADEVVDPFNPNAIHASTGAVFRLPVVAAAGPVLRAELAQRGITLILTSPRAEQLYTQCDLRRPVAIVIGPEDTGLSDDWFDANTPQQSVRIPMQGPTTDSLNASVSAALLLYEAVRQRALP